MLNFELRVIGFAHVNSAVGRHINEWGKKWQEINVGWAGHRAYDRLYRFDSCHRVAQRVFGFREREEARLNWPGGGVTWFEVGNSLFNISTPDEVWRRKPDTPGLMMKVYVEDVDKHFAHAKAEGARLVSEPEDEFWGGRIYRVLDHEGHQWEISQRGRDLAADRWQLPPGVTRGVLR